MALTPVGVKLVVEGEQSFTGTFLKVIGAITNTAAAVTKSTAVMDAFNKAVKAPEVTLKTLTERLEAQAREFVRTETELKRLNVQYGEMGRQQQKLTRQIGEMVGQNEIYQRKLKLLREDHEKLTKVLQDLQAQLSKTGAEEDDQKAAIERVTKAIQQKEIQILSVEESQAKLLRRYEETRTELFDLAEGYGTAAEAIQRKKDQLIDLNDKMDQTTQQIGSMSDAMGIQVDVVGRGTRAFSLMVVAAQNFSPLFSGMGRAIQGVNTHIINIIGALGRGARAIIEFGASAVKSFGDFVRNVTDSARTVAGKLNDIIASLLGLKDKTKETSDFWESAWGRMINIAGGILIRDGIRAIIGWLGELSGSMVGTLSNFQGLEIQLEGLMARELKRGKIIEGIETVVVASSEKQKQAYAGLQAKQVLLTQAVADAKAKLDELTSSGTANASQILSAQAGYEKWSKQLETVNGQLKTMWTGIGYTTDALVPHVEGAMSAKDAWAQAGGKAQELIEWIKVMAVTTPFTVQSLQKVLAMGMAMGFSSTQAKELTTTVGNFTAGMGLGEAQMERIIYAFGQIKSAGRLLGTEVRQLTESFVPVRYIFEQIAEESGMTWQEVRDGLKDGSLDLQLFFDKFTNLVQEDFANSAKRMSRTWQGVTSNIQDFVQAVLGVEVLGPTFDRMTGMMADALEKLMKPEVRSFFKKLGLTLLGVFDSIVRALKPFGDAFTKTFGVIMGAVGQAGNIIGQVFRTITEDNVGQFLMKLNGMRSNVTDIFGKDMADAITNFAIKAQDRLMWVKNSIAIFTSEVRGQLGEGSSWSSAFAKAAMAVLGFGATADNVWVRFARLVGKVVDFVILSMAEIKPTLIVLGGVFNAVFMAIGEVLKIFGAIFSGIVTTITTDMPQTRDIVKSVWDSIRGSLQSVTDYIINTVLPWLRGIRITIEENWPAIKTKAEEVFGKVKEIWDKYIGGIWNWIKENGPKIAAGLMGAFASTELLGALGTLGQVIGALTNPLTLITTLVGILAGAWATNWGNIQGAMPTIVEDLKGILGSLIAFVEETVMPALGGIGLGGLGDEETGRGTQRVGGLVNLEEIETPDFSKNIVAALVQAVADVRKWVDTELIPTLEKVVVWVEENWPKIEQTIGGVLKTIQDIWNGGGKQVFEWILNNLPKVVTIILGLQILGPIFAALGAVMAVVAPTLVSISALIPILTAAGVAAGMVIPTLLLLASGFLVVTGVIAGIVLAIAAYVTNFQGFRDTVDGIVSQIVNFITGIPRAIADVGGKILAFLTQNPEEVSRQVTEWASNLGNQFRGTLERVWAWLSTQVWPAIQNFFKTISIAFYNFTSTENLMAISRQIQQVGLSVLEGIAKGILGGIMIVINALISVVATIIGFITGLLGISSPSTVMEQMVGAPMMEGIVVAILGAIPNLLTALSTAFGNLVAGAEQGWSNLKTQAEGFFTGLANGIAGTWEWIKGQVVGTNQEIVNDTSMQWDNTAAVVQRDNMLIYSDSVDRWDATKKATTDASKEIATTVPLNWQDVKNGVTTNNALMASDTALKFGEIEATALTSATNIAEGISFNWDSAYTTIQTQGSNIQEETSQRWGGIQEEIDTTTSNIDTNLETLWGGYYDTVSGYNLDMYTDTDTQWGDIESFMSTTHDNMDIQIGDSWEGYQDTVTASNEAMYESTETAWTAIGLEIDTTLTYIESSVQSKFDSLITILTSAADTMANAITRGFTAFRISGVDSLSSSLSHLASSIDHVISRLRELAETMANTQIPSGLQPGSPSPLEVGVMGATRAVDELTDSFSELGKTWTHETPTGADIGYTFMENVAYGIQTGTTMAVQAAANAARDIANTISTSADPFVIEPNIGGGTSYLGPPVAGGGPLDEILEAAKQASAQYQDPTSLVHYYAAEAGQSLDDYLKGVVTSMAVSMGLDPETTWNMIYGQLHGQRGDPGTTDPPWTDPGTGTDPFGGGTKGTGSYELFDQAVQEFARAVKDFAYVLGVSVGQYTDPATTTGGGTGGHTSYLGPPVPIAPPANGNQMAARYNGQRVVNNSYAFNVQANYSEKQSPVRIRDDISLMLQMAQV